MLNTRQNKIKNSIRTILQLFIFITGVFSVLFYSSNTIADTDRVECLNFEIVYHSHFLFVDPKHYKSLHDYHNRICERVEDGRWDHDKANKVMNNILFRMGICRDARINPEYEQQLKKLEVPDSVVLSHNHFCRDTYNPNNKITGINLKTLNTQTTRLSVEIFCQTIHGIAYPTGFWETLLEPDLPIIEDYKKRTDSICQQLRNGDIQYGEAVNRWEQANLEFDNRYLAESLKKMGKDLKKPIESLIETLKDIYK